ncbi:DUF6318 family protein [Paenarthrobacter aromaticivorans]|nr:DUF6318 family protein [Paenarthrobacter sp. MMS21-TAE1-1]
MSRLFTFSSRARIRGAVFGFTAALLLTGCQGGQPGSPSETSSTTASPTSAVLSSGPSATESSGSAVPAAVYKPADAKGKAENVPVPVMPELAKENSKAGLEAFIRYYYELKSHANETGDVAALATLSTPECIVCSHMMEASIQGYKTGRWMVGGTFQVPAIEMDWQPDEASHLSRVQVIQDAISYFNSDGSQGRPADIATNDVFVVVAQFQTTWKVVDTGVVR